MQESEPAEQDDDESLAEKRAKWEHLRFAPCVGVGKVNVCNVSYGVQAKSDHTYTVSVESGIPFDCTCPNWTYNNPPKGCKHMIAVSNAPDVMDEAQPNVVTDGGTKTIYTADCDTCMYSPTAYESGPAHDAKDRHEDDCEGHNVTVRVDEREDMHLGLVSSDGEY